MSFGAPAVDAPVGGGGGFSGGHEMDVGGALLSGFERQAAMQRGEATGAEGGVDPVAKLGIPGQSSGLFPVRTYARK